MQKIDIASLLDTKFIEVRELYAITLKELLALLNNESTDKTDQIKSVSEKLRTLIRETSHIDEKCIFWLQLLPPALQAKYRTQLTATYCFSFVSQRTLDQLQGSEDGNEDWQTLNRCIVRNFPFIINSILENPEYELYFCKALVSMLIEMVKSKHYLYDEAEAKMLVDTYKIIKYLVTQIKSNALRAQCEVVIFCIEIEDLLKDCAHIVRMEGADYSRHHSSISPYLAELEKEDSKFIAYFAKLTKIYNQLNAIILKIEYIQEPQRNKKVPDYVSPLKVQSYGAVLCEVQRLFKEMSLLNQDKLLQDALKKPSFRIVFQKLIQTDEILLSVLEVMKKIFDNFIKIKNYVLQNTQDKANDWQIFYDALSLKKLSLMKIVFVEDLIAILKKEKPDHTNTNLQLQQIDATLTRLNGVKREKETLSTQLVAKLDAELVKKLSKKLQKERKLREDFLQMRLGQRPSELKGSEDTKSYNYLNSQAEQFISKNMLNQALNAYELLLSNKKSLSIIELVLTYIAIADIYKRKHRDDLAIQSYQNAIKIAEKKLAEQPKVDFYEELQIQYEIAKDSKAELESISQILSEIDNSQDVDLPSPTSDTEQDPCTIDPTIEKVSIPLPELFDKIYKLFSSMNLKVFVVGGCIPDFYLKETTNDIDITVHAPDSSCNQQDLLKELLLAVRKYNSSYYSRIKGHAHPVLSIQYNGVSLELSILEKKPEKTNFSTADPRFELLYPDAKTRDATQNALYYDPKSGEVIDFFNGLADIKAKKFKLIKPPGVSFAEDPYRIFRVIRSIVKLSAHNPELVFDESIIDEMRNVCVNIHNLKKDRCSTEIVKILLRGHALDTWRFLVKHELHKFIFCLPKNEESCLRHSKIIAACLANLDKRLNQRRSFNLGFIFAVILWGKFNEELERIKHKQGDLTLTAASELTFDLLFTKVPFHLTDDVIKVIKKLWLRYLQKSDLVTNNSARFHDFKMLRVFSRLLQRDSKESHTKFFKMNTEQQIKAMIQENNVAYSYNNKFTILSLTNNSEDSSPERNRNLLCNIKQTLQLILGKKEVFYEQSDNAISFGTNLAHKKIAIEHLMKSLFNESYLTHHPTTFRREP